MNIANEFLKMLSDAVFIHAIENKIESNSDIIVYINVEQFKEVNEDLFRKNKYGYYESKFVNAWWTFLSHPNIPEYKFFISNIAEDDKRTQEKIIQQFT